MESIKKIITTEIHSIITFIENEKINENNLTENIFIDKSQINYKDRHLGGKPQNIKIFIKNFSDKFESIIKSFNRDMKIDKLKSTINNQINKIYNLLKQYEIYNNQIIININYPNNEIKLEEQTQKNLSSLYNKFIKKYENSHKELINRFKYFLAIYKNIFECLKQLSQKIKDYTIEFENTGEKMNEILDLQDDDPRFYPIQKEIFKIYIHTVESFLLFDEYFFEIHKKKEFWEKDKIFNSLNKMKNIFNTEVDKFKSSFQEIENYFPKINININEINKIENELLDYMNNLREFKIDDYSKLVYQNIMREDILIILDITNSMGKYLKILKEKLHSIIEQIKHDCPLAIIYLGFIGYKDFCDLELGDEYIDLELTLNYENIYNNIKDLEVDGGGDIPEDVAGAFEMALKKNWGAGHKIAFLITDSPCHGIEYHNLDQSKENYKDNYPNGHYIGENEEDEEFQRREMRVLVKEFSDKNITLACLNILQLTDKMYSIFKDIYENNQKKELFIVEKKDLDKFIILESTQFYKEKEIIDYLKTITQIN